MRTEPLKPKEVVLYNGELKSPPLSLNARIEAGQLLRRLQDGELRSMPLSRPMPVIGARCHELRVRDASKNWRIIYRIDSDEIVIVDVFNKTVAETPLSVIRNSMRRLADSDHAKD